MAAGLLRASRAGLLVGASVLASAACSSKSAGNPGTPDGGGAVDGPVDVLRQDATIACNAPVAETPVTSIAGAWTFTPMGAAATEIQVPGGGWFKQGFTASTATYATRITVPTLPNGAPQTTLIEFGAVNHQATLSVDGTMVGTNMTAFTPSVFDVTRFVTPGAGHNISVVVLGREAFRAANGLKSVPDAANWSPNVPQGIFRSAAIRAYPDVYISDVFVKTSVATGTLSYDVSVTNSSTRSRQLTLSGTLDSWNCDKVDYPALPGSTSVTAPASGTVTVTVGPLPWGLGPETYWWPNVPYVSGYKAKLHNLRVALHEVGGGVGVGAGAAVVHERLTRFGFRETTQAQADAQNTYYYLNGVRVNFRGDNLNGLDYDSILTGTGRGDAFDTLPGFLPPAAGNPGWPQAVDNFQRLNYNVVRIHQEPAPPYILDVADEMGLMIIDESAIRGPSDQNFIAGHDNMVSHVRALVLRDRNHPSIIRWSQSNEPNLTPTDSAKFEQDLYMAIMGLDSTRPVSVDAFGPKATYDTLTYPNFNVIPHYLDGFGLAADGGLAGLYTDAVLVRSDRPYGQGEHLWPADNTRQGLAWFATSTMAMRAKNASDIRPYTLLSGWASVIPGVDRTTMVIEQNGNPLYGIDNLSDPWSDPVFVRIQRAFNPLLVADVDYWAANHLSNANGDWPIDIPVVAKDAVLPRNLVVFNDTFAGTAVELTWEMHTDSATGAIASMGTQTLNIALGARMTVTIQARTPATGTRAYLVLRAAKDGVTVFEDTATTFTLM